MNLHLPDFQHAITQIHPHSRRPVSAPVLIPSTVVQSLLSQVHPQISSSPSSARRSQRRGGSTRHAPIARRPEELPTLRICNPPPNDSGYYVFFVVVLHGMTVFAPWTMIATVHENYFLNQKMNSDYVNTNLTPLAELKTWRDLFAIRMAFAALGTHLVLTVLNCLLQISKCRLGVRITIALMLAIVCYLVNTFATITETGEAFHFFLYLSMSVMVLLSVALGIYHSSIWGIISYLPIRYCNAFLMGNNLMGVLCSIFIISVTVLKGDTKVTTALFFLSGTILLLFAVANYFIVTVRRFFRYYVQYVEIAELQTAQEWSGLNVWNERWHNFLDIFITYFVTYTIYPNLAMWIDISDFLNDIDVQLKTQIFCFLTFNVCSLLGNCFANYIQMPCQRLLWIFTYSRLVFLPFFAVLNYSKPGRSLRFHSVLTSSGVFYWILVMTLALTHGYASSLAMIYPTRFGITAAMMSVIFLVLGIGSGLGLSLLIAKILLI